MVCLHDPTPEARAGGPSLSSPLPNQRRPQRADGRVN